ncbi:transmembrane protein C1orf162 homolog [Tenrec ecaudatus]|uniref:transmembrane protein C1orf162 homolog n=1 Tax=Tenrec ecaudatus TaxID=94439 RepID=UPI003F5A04D5
MGPSSLPNSKEVLHLVLAFCAGVLLTLLLMALVFLIIKSYRKCHSSSQVLDPPMKSKLPLLLQRVLNLPANGTHSSLPCLSWQLSATSEDSLTYATMAFRTSSAKSTQVTEDHQDPIVYAQINEVN